MVTHEDGFEIERLRAEVAQEKQMKEMLEQSMSELQVTVEELDKRIDSIDDENSEWKTRYDTQTEMNQQLEKQVLVLQDKCDDARRTIRESKGPRLQREAFNEQTEITHQYLAQLVKDRDALGRQLGDLEWRLDQESKAYHKANEERKQFVLEINTARETLNNIQSRQNALYQTPRDDGTPRGSQPHGLMNIPQNHRIIDPKRGPIRKTAAVKNLPRLE